MPTAVDKSVIPASEKYFSHLCEFLFWSMFADDDTVVLKFV